MSNRGAEMTVLDVRHFVGWGLGNAPKRPIVCKCGMPRNATQFLRRDGGAGWLKGAL